MELSENKYTKIEELDILFEKINAISELNFSSELELINYVLERVIESTNSHIGFFHFVNDDQETLELTTWSQETLLNCTAAQDNHYPISSAGIWVEAFYKRESVIYNDYKNATGKKGVPVGHFPLIRFISTPVIREDKVKCIVGIGNKTENYTTEDVQKLELYMKLLWNLLENIRYKEQLQHQTKLLDDIYTAFDLLSEMIILTDRFKNVEFLNKSFYENFRIRNKRFISKNILQLISTIFTFENTSHIFAKLDEVGDSKKVLSFEVNNLGKFYKMHLKLLAIKESNQPKILIRIEDITEDKEFEESMTFNKSLLSMHKESFEAIIYSEYLNELHYQFCVIASKYLRSRFAFIGKLIDVGEYYKLIMLSIYTNEIITNTENFNLMIDKSHLSRLMNGEDRVLILDKEQYSNIVAEFGINNNEKLALINISNYVNTHLLLFIWDERVLDWHKMFNIVGVLIDRLKLGIDLLNAKKTKEKTEKLLIIEKKQLAINLNTISDGIITLNNIGNIIYANKPLENILEVNSDSIIGKKFFDTFTFYNEKFEKVLFNPFDYIIKDSEEIKANKFAYITKTNLIKNIEVVLKAIYDNDCFSGIVIIIKDLSELYHFQAQLNLAQKMETLGLLSAGIAHEINTPLQYVNDNLHFIKESFHSFINYIKFLESQNREDIVDIQNELETDYLKSEIPVAVESAYSGIKRIIRIIEAMKNFSHKSNNEKTLADINKLLIDTITITRNDWKSTAEIETNFENPILEIFCLPDELMQVFLNLIINAVHAIKKQKEANPNLHGIVTVTTKEIEEHIEITIEDNGCGIAAQNISRIFEPFYTTKPTGLGTGQGLTITKDIIVNKHKGEIKVESDLNLRTKFIIYLPNSR